MMVFMDSWGWIALANRRDGCHSIAHTTYAALGKSGERFVTSDYVLSETISRLYPYVGPERASQFIDGLLRSNLLDIQFVGPERFEQAWSLRRRYADKPDISFVDLTSMVIMQDLGIEQVFTGDHHFEQVGLGFRLVPENS